MTRIFDACARWLSRPWVCAAFIGVLIPGFGFGWLSGWSPDYLLAFNLYMSAVPYAVMFLVLYSQARDTLANQVQQGELIRAIPGARNELIGLEAKSPEEIEAERMRVELQESPP
jgi:low affinity Fe/Cu permease